MMPVSFKPRATSTPLPRSFFTDKLDVPRYNVRFQRMKLQPIVDNLGCKSRQPVYKTDEPEANYAVSCSLYKFLMGDHKSNVKMKENGFKRKGGHLNRRSSKDSCETWIAMNDSTRCLFQSVFNDEKNRQRQRRLSLEGSVCSQRGSVMLKSSSQPNHIKSENWKRNKPRISREQQMGVTKDNSSIYPNEVVAKDTSNETIQFWGIDDDLSFLGYLMKSG